MSDYLYFDDPENATDTIEDVLKKVVRVDEETGKVYVTVSFLSKFEVLFGAYETHPVAHPTKEKIYWLTDGEMYCRNSVTAGSAIRCITNPAPTTNEVRHFMESGVIKMKYWNDTEWVETGAEWPI